jgi:predicted MFS family arabinose efflux permease
MRRDSLLPNEGAAMAVESAETTDRSSSVRGSILETRDSIASVFRNPNLRKVQLAGAGSMVGDWAYATAVTVWAYDVGGAKAVGIWGAARYVLMAFTSPLGSSLADRLPRKAVMVAADVARAAVILAATVCLWLGTPAWPVFVLATCASLLGCIFRPAQMALLPSLTDHPQELTAANGTASTIESLAFFVGPAIGATLVGLTNVETVFLLDVATFVWSAALVLGLRPHPVADPPGGGSGPGGEEQSPGMLAEMAAGFTTIRASRDLTMVAVLVCAQTVVAGAMLVYTVIFAVDLLHTGPQGVGYIDSVFGVGAIVGGFYAIARAARNHLANDLAMGTVLWALPLLLVVAWPSPATVFASAVVMGFGNPLVDVNFATIVQRITPDAVMGRVFGAFEGALIGGMALGSAVMPWLGLRSALAVVGVLVAAAALAYLPRCRQLDSTMVEPEGTSLLRGIPMFSPLTRATLENLARQLTPEHAAAGTVVLREGEESDRFLVIRSGSVEVTQGGRVLRAEGPGDYFGEIGLLRDVPRTATVTATEDTELLALSRNDFLDAVSGDESRIAADDIVARRLG